MMHKTYRVLKSPSHVERHVLGGNEYRAEAECFF